MKIFEIAKFFGFSSKNEDLDKFLSAHDISERPIFTESPIELITRKEQGLSLWFETDDYYKETYGPLHKEGGMILTTVQVYSEYHGSKFSRYLGTLPFGLQFESTLEEAITILGQPRNSHRSGPLNQMYSWSNFQGYQVSLSFLPEGKKIALLSLSPKEIYGNN
ncbi:hypothetical protein PO883_32970 [Massilia sp. DJPM01]|uniref:hypothetical protein n=1 Tax=Massilia sp. DJPM01 TaxID=3024404 RepID=UPI00259F6629|nr:hypothetical protein [Massilia sp. DJPM01]MDM5181988.1 hypothetical protein [Massilia sp. DJPM01]